MFLFGVLYAFYGEIGCYFCSFVLGKSAHERSAERRSVDVAGTVTADVQPLVTVVFRFVSALDHNSGIALFDAGTGAGSDLFGFYPV